MFGDRSGIAVIKHLIGALSPKGQGSHAYGVTLVLL